MPTTPEETRAVSVSPPKVCGGKRAAWAGAICALTLSTAEAEAQTSGAPEAIVVQLDDIVVRGRRDSALGPVEHELSAVQVDALLARNIGGVVAQLQEMLGDRSEATFVINGRRVADPSIFLRLPPDALEKVEVLAAGSAAGFGGDPVGRTYNLVVAQEFFSRDVRLALHAPTAGGFTRTEAETRMTSLEGARVMTGGLVASRASALRGGERSDWLAGRPGSEDVTLAPASDVVAADLAFNRPVGAWSAGLTLNAQQTRSAFTALHDVESYQSRLEARSFQAAANAGGSVRDWFLTARLAGLWTRSAQSGPDPLQQAIRTVDASLAANRRFDALPAGPIIANLSANFSRSGLEGEGLAAEGPQRERSDRLAGNLTIPLLSGTAHSSWRGGTASIVLGAAASATDTGGGRSSNMGINWSPFAKVRLTGSWARTEEAPTARQRLDPMTFGAPVAVYDFLHDEAVEVTPILGGNPALRPPRNDLTFASLSVGPFTSRQFLLGVTWNRLESIDGIVSILPPTPDNEAAFPERFIRDEQQRLVRIDHRPFNLAGTISDSLMTNLSFAPSTGLQVSAAYTLRLEDTLDFGQGAELDRLSGDAGGSGRQSAFVKFDGLRGELKFGAALRWEEGFRRRELTGVDGVNDLHVGDFATLDLDLSYRFVRDLSSGSGEGIARRGEGLRLELSIANVFDRRRSARLGDGRLAPGYGRDDQDPIGRTVRVTLAKRL